MNKPLHLLIVEDSEDDALLLIREMRRGGYDPIFERIETPEAMKRALETRQWDIIIADYVLPKFSGLDALTLLREGGLDLPFIIVSGNIGEDIAVEAMKAGAHDYLIKGSLARLVPAVERELREAEARHERRDTERRIGVTSVLLGLFSQKFNRKEYLDAAIKEIQEWSGCHHMGIRVTDEYNTIPYISCVGFSPDFMETENVLSLDTDHCACIRVIAGTPEPQDRPAMTTKGSFYLNNSRQYVEGLQKHEQDRFRGVCVRSGFTSIAIIPVRYRDMILGALHLADERADMVPLQSVEFLEYLAQILGEAIYRFGIEEERNRLVSAVEFSADAIVITEPVKGIIQYVNKAFEKITGYGRNEVIGRGLHLLDSGRHDAAFYRELRETLAREGVWSGQVVNKKKNGSLYYEECTISPVLGPSGEIVNYISVKRNVTEKRRLESIAESVNTMNNIGYVFSGVRHEIGNPVNSAKMSLSVLLRKLDDASKDVVRNYVERTLYEIGRVEQLLKSLKNYNLFERPELIDLDLGVFMNKFIPLIAEDFGRKGITITCDAGSGAVWAIADPRALQQVVLNIMTNAADALNGRENPLIAIAVTRERGRARLRITDNGIGMTEKQQNNLFKPFYTSKAQGTGLGLVIVKKMLTMIDGHIDVTSIHQQGTTVDIDLPEGRDDAGQ